MKEMLIYIAAGTASLKTGEIKTWESVMDGKVGNPYGL